MHTTISTPNGDVDVAISAGKVRRKGKTYAEAYFSVDLDVHVLGSFPMPKTRDGALGALFAADEVKRAREAFEAAGNKVAYLRSLGFEI